MRKRESGRTLSRFIRANAIIGAQIRAQRLWRGVSQKDLSRAIGFGRGQLCAYERGLRTISAPKLAIIAAMLDVPVAHLLPAAIVAQHEGLPV